MHRDRFLIKVEKINTPNRAQQFHKFSKNQEVKDLIGFRVYQKYLLVCGAPHCSGFGMYFCCLWAATSGKPAKRLKSPRKCIISDYTPT